MSAVHSIEQDSDMLAKRAGYERAAASVTAQATFGFTLLTALYVALSPWIVGFNATTTLAVNDLIVGITVAVLTFGFASALDRTHGMTWILPVFGVWLIISPWILRDVSPTAGMIWSNVLAGALITLFGLFAPDFGRRRVLSGR